MIIQHYIQLLCHYRKLVIRIIATTTISAAVISILLLLVYPMYTGTASVVMLPTEAELAFTASWIGGSQYHPANVMTQTQMEYLISRPVAEKTYQKLAADLAAMPKPTGFSALLKDAFNNVIMSMRWAYNMMNSGTFVKLSPYEDLLQKLRDGIKIEMVESSYILQISATLPDARAAALAANTIAQSYDEMIAEQSSNANKGMQVFFQQELAKNQAKMDDLVHQEYDLREELGLLSLEEERDYLQQARENERQALANSIIDLQVQETRIKALDNNQVNVTQSDLQAQLDSEKALQGLNRIQFKEIIALRRANIDSLSHELDILSSRQEPLLKLQREMDAVERDIEGLQARMMSVNLSTYSSMSQVRTVNPAVVPYYPSSPEVVLYTVIGLVAGIFIAFFWLIAIDSLTGKVKTLNDLHNIVGTNAVGRLSPLMRMQATGKTNRFLKGQDFLAGSLTELMYGLPQDQGTPGNPLLVSGFFAKESLTPENLATLGAGLAAEGRPVVVIIPGNLELPQVATEFQGKLWFVRSADEHLVSGALYLTVQPDIAPWDLLQQAHVAPVTHICLVPAGKMTEDRLGDFHAALEDRAKTFRYIIADG